ncbi:MAG: tetratricopeptide repeat protein [Rhodospirillaceae bacterium]
MTQPPDTSHAEADHDTLRLYVRCMAAGDDLLAQGRTAEAKLQFENALLIQPESVDALYKIGSVYYLQDQEEEAVRVLTKANTSKPNTPEILNTLGAALARMGRVEEAVDAFQQVFQMNPSHAAAALNCGRLLLDHGFYLQAEGWLTKAADLRPNDSKILQHLAHARLALGQPRLAITAADLAVAANSENSVARLLLGQAYLSIRKLEAAHTELSRVLVEMPNHPEALYYLAETEEKLGRTEQARSLYARVVELDVDPEFRALTQLKSVLALPVISQSVTEIQTSRQAILSALNELPRTAVKDPYSAGGFTNFYLTYQGEDDKEIQQRIAAFYLSCCPDLARTAPHIGKRPAHSKYRIGILSSFLRNHTVGYLCRGLIEHLDRDRFEVVLLRCPVLPIEDPLAPVLARAADEVIDLPDNLIQAREKIAQVAADLIYFPEVGMEDLVYFLAFARSAPVQVMGWGHPVTTGIPNMDFFLSVADMEPQDAQEHYTEQLIPLDGLSVCVKAPAVPEMVQDKSSFGMIADAPAYLCAQSLYKIHPDFDDIAAGLLEKDAAARLYFMSLTDHADELFLSRLAQKAGDNMDRVRMLKRVPSKDFIALLRCVDVLLDIPHWAGGKTSLESLATGTPIVHWPGRFMRGRHTLAFYRKMDVLDCVVNSTQGYVETAYRLVHDLPFRTAVRNKIAASSALLFNDTSAIDEISDVFEKLILERR